MKLAMSAVTATVLALVVVACGGDKGTATSADLAALEESAWVLSDGVDVDGWEQVAPSIGFDQGRVSGSNGCNSFGGSYETDGSSLRFGELAATMKGCPPPAAEVEQAFMGQLETASEWRLEDGELTLGGGESELRFCSASPEGSWRATSLLRGDAVSTLLPGSEVTAEFGADGDLAGSAGCNRYGGGYRTDGSSISIGDLFSTEMACEPSVMEQEQAFLKALPRAAQFRLERGNLMLLSAMGTVVATFEPAPEE